MSLTSTTMNLGQFGLSALPAIPAEKRPALPGWREYQKRPAAFRASNPSRCWSFPQAGVWEESIEEYRKRLAIRRLLSRPGPAAAQRYPARETEDTG
jgi:hypothetical protein